VASIVIEPICIGFFTVVVSSLISTHQLCASRNCVRITNIYREFLGGAVVDDSTKFRSKISHVLRGGAGGVYMADANATRYCRIWGTCDNFPDLSTLYIFAPSSMSGHINYEVPQNAKIVSITYNAQYPYSGSGTLYLARPYSSSSLAPYLSHS
jgi:hypothetical protein